jgi:hypothetical protein
MPALCTRKINMLKLSLKIAWRQISRNKVYAIIHIAGLALGISSCIVIFLIVYTEFSFDNFHPGKEQIYHLGCKQSNLPYLLSRVPGPMPEAMRNEIAGLDAVAGFYLYDAGISIKNTDKKLQTYTSAIDGSNQTSVIITDSHYFDIFKYDWLAGSVTTSLESPFKVVLSASKARKYFGYIPYSSIIGKELVYNDSLSVTVSGIINDWDGNTDFPFTEFISLSSISSSNFLKATYQSRTESWESRAAEFGP